MRRNNIQATMSIFQRTTSISREDREKFQEIVLYICNEYGTDDLTQMKLWKILFFCEADYVERHGERLTKVPFIKNTYGPTPDFTLTQQLIDDLVKKGDIFLRDNKNISTNNKVFQCTKQPNLDKLSARDLESIQKTCEKYFLLTASQLSSLSHQDPVYLAAEPKSKLDFSFVRYRSEEEEERKLATKEVVKFSPKAMSKLAALFN